VSPWKSREPACHTYTLILIKKSRQCPKAFTKNPAIWERVAVLPIEIDDIPFNLSFFAGFMRTVE
jgi:hypothetical protein